MNSQSTSSPSTTPVAETPVMTPEQYAAEMRALSKVQRRTFAIGFAAITLHGVLGLIFVADHLHEAARTPEAILMLVMSAFASFVTVAVVRLILGKTPFPVVWHLVGLAVPVVGGIVVLSTTGTIWH